MCLYLKPFDFFFFRRCDIASLFVPRLSIIISLGMELGNLQHLEQILSIEFLLGKFQKGGQELSSFYYHLRRDEETVRKHEHESSKSLLPLHF